MASARVAVVLLLVACALQSAAGRGRFFPSRYYATGPRAEPMPASAARRHSSQHRTSHQLRPYIAHQHHLRAASSPDLPPPPSPPSATTPPIHDAVRFARRRLPRPETRRAWNSRARMLVTSHAPRLVRRPGHQARLGGGHRFRPRELLVTDSDGGTFEIDRGTGQTVKVFDGTDRDGDEVEILEEVPRAASSADGGGGPAYDSMQRLGRQHHGRHGRRAPRQHSVVRYSNPILDSMAEQNEKMGGPPGGILAGYTDLGSGSDSGSVSEERTGGDWPMLDAIDEQNGRMGGSDFGSDYGSDYASDGGSEGGSEGEWLNGSDGGWIDGSGGEWEDFADSKWYDGSDAGWDDGSGGVWDDGSGGGWDVGSEGGSDDGSNGGWHDNSEGGWDDGTGSDGSSNDSSDDSTWEGDYGNIDNENGGDDYFSEPSDVEDSVYPTGGDYYTSDTGDSAAALKPMVPRAAATHRPPRAVALSTPVPPNRATQAKQVKRQAGARGSGSQAKPVKRPGNYHGGSAHATPGHHNGKPSPSAHVAANQHAGTARAKPARAKPTRAVGGGVVAVPVARAAKHSTLVAPTGQGQAQGQGAGGASGSGGGSFSSSGGGLVATPGAGSGGSGGTGGTGSGGSTGSTGSGSGTGSGGAVSSPDPAAGDASYDDGDASDADADDATPVGPPAGGSTGDGDADDGDADDVTPIGPPAEGGADGGADGGAAGDGDTDDGSAGDGDTDDGAAGDGDADDVTPDDPPADGVPIPPVLPPTTPPTTPPPTTAPPSTPPPSTPPTTPPPITTPPTTPPPTTTPPTTPPPSTTPPTTPPPTTTPHHLRCGVAPGSLLNALNWACGPGGADCSSIQPGGACFQPGNLALHASVAFNSIFHSHAHRPGSCFFGGNAVVVPHVPDYAAGPATCTFPSSNGQFCVAACQEIPDPYSPPQGLVNPVYPQYSPEPDYPPRGVVAPGGGGGGRGGCAADMGAVQRALDWACGPGGVDCSPILPGGACWQGNGALAAHASHAFTAYFYRHNHQPGTCFFGGTAVVVPRVPDYAAGPPSCTWPSDNGQYCVVGC